VWLIKNLIWAGHWWLRPVILATQEAEIRSISVQSQAGQILRETLSWKYLTQKGLWSGSRSTPWVQTPVPKKKKKRILSELGMEVCVYNPGT
jgi:hypothetical protein